MADFTSTFKFEKPAFATLRYDQALNIDLDRLDAGLKGWSNASQPGAASNYDDIVPADGIRWYDSGNEVCKIRINGSYQSILSCEEEETGDPSGDSDLTDWGTSIGSTPRYCLKVKINDQEGYIPFFTTK